MEQGRAIGRDGGAALSYDPARRLCQTSKGAVTTRMQYDGSDPVNFVDPSGLFGGGFQGGPDCPNGVEPSGIICYAGQVVPVTGSRLSFCENGQVEKSMQDGKPGRLY